MSKKQKGGGNLGRQLIKDRFGRTNKKKVDQESMLHTTEVQDGYDWARLNLSSVTEESSFQEFLRTAELAGTEFQAEKLNIAFINSKQNAGLLSKMEQCKIEQKHKDHKNLLKIPRRPKWTKDTSADDLQRAENENFLEWRRNLSRLQEDEDIIMTPYEKNLEFWRQLWRVIERSDVIAQIVDARNPLLFRSEDLEKYVNEVDPNKVNMILINKSDLLTEEQRKHWAAYFEKEGIHIAFFSAHLSLEDEDKPSEERSSNNDVVDDDNNDDDSKKLSDEQNQLSLSELKSAAKEISNSLDKLEKNLELIERKLQMIPMLKNSFKILNRLELTDYLKAIYTGKTYTPNVTTIGLVGYPNVGKSSTINALMRQKKVSVSATPGKTKHFQTLFLDNDLLLCDCPGLVMPSFVLTKADMILNGILPIDQMRDHVPAVNLLCQRIPRHVLEDKYGIVIAKPSEYEDPNRPPNAEELLLAYGYNRGFMTSNGQPDQSRSARFILKDYVNGKLLYAVAPPSIEQDKFHFFPPKLRKEILEEFLPGQQQRAMRINKIKSSKELDQQFFQSRNSQAYIKGRINFPHIRVSQDANKIDDAECVKPWRRVKKEKREKLRRKFSHLDQH